MMQHYTEYNMYTDTLHYTNSPQPSMSEIMQMRIDANSRLVKNPNDNDAKGKLAEATSLVRYTRPHGNTVQSVMFSPKMLYSLFTIYYLLLTNPPQMTKWALKGSSATSGKYTGIPLKIAMGKEEIDSHHPAVWARKVATLALHCFHSMIV